MDIFSLSPGDVVHVNGVYIQGLAVVKEVTTRTAKKLWLCDLRLRCVDYDRSDAGKISAASTEEAAEFLSQFNNVVCAWLDHRADKCDEELTRVLAEADSLRRQVADLMNAEDRRDAAAAGAAMIKPGFEWKPT